MSDIAPLGEIERLALDAMHEMGFIHRDIN